MKIVIFLLMVIAYLYYKSSNESFQNVECEQPQKCQECEKCPECPFMGVPEKCPECPRCPVFDEEQMCKKYVEKNWSYPQWTYLDPKEIYKGHQKPPVCAMDKDFEGNVIVRKEPDAVLAETKFTNYLEAHQNTNVGDFLPKKKLIRDADFYNKYDKCYHKEVNEHINNEKINDQLKNNYTQKWQKQQEPEYKFLEPKN
jgi:hypothetical protein